MERLQAAIEKARAQREGAGPGRKPKKPEAPRRSSAPAAALQALDDTWLAVPEIKLKRGLLHRNRIVAFQSGPAAAPYDIMRTRLIQQATANDWSRIAVVSPRTGSGKSTTVANLAFGLARQSGVRTLALDFDLRRNGLGRILGQKGHVPMADVLEGQVPFRDIAQRYGRNLIFGLGFGASQRSSEILQGDQARTVLEGIEAEYRPDLMIFDLPPLSASDDNLGFLTRVDAALIVVEAGKTRTSQIDVAERQVAELTQVMGIVLNKCRYTSGAYGYEEGYY